MGSRSGRRKQRWCSTSVQPLTPLMEGPDPDTSEGNNVGSGKKERSWELIRSWVRTHKTNNNNNNNNNFSSSSSAHFYTNSGRSPSNKRLDLRLVLSVLGCPLAPVSLLQYDPVPHSPITEIPIERSSAHYIIQQYLAATGCLKHKRVAKNMYATGSVRMVCCETEIGWGGKTTSAAAAAGSRGMGDSGCFVLWQMSPGMWSVELVVSGVKVVAGSNGKTVWRHMPWLGTHAAKGPQRPLRRIIQGLDPKSTANLFANAQCICEKRIGVEDCFVLKVAADRAAVVERIDGPAEVIRHVLYGYFSQKSGLLIHLEDSHLTRVQAPGADTVYWETTIGSSVGDYREVDGTLIAHQGRSVATVFRFGEVSVQNSRTRMEEVWRIDDVVYNVPGLSLDYFIPPADISDNANHSP
ncbi:hypothetical protein Sjap_000065 [Stephania japonica]|uniref:Uncharacterized protein n=1 Tax=Stephania japonica TaxID=461633 RepID=A0AAP0KI99_9MAGN